MLTAAKPEPPVRAILAKLRCPKCRGPVGDGPLPAVAGGLQELRCALADHRFRVVNGVPILLDDNWFDPSTINPDPMINPQDHLNWKKMQIQYHHDENVDEDTREYELRRPYGENRLFETMGTYDLELARKFYPATLRDKSVLTLCCGRGMDAEFFWRAGATVAGTDIVPSCLEIAQERLTRAGGSIDTFCCDAEDVPLRDDSFDICEVHDGLHHLPRPFAAIEEMARIAREGLIIIEPNRSPIVRVFQRLGVSTEVEASGNHKTYFDARDLERRLRGLGFDQVHIGFSFYKKTHHPPKIYDLLSHEPLHTLVKAGLGATRTVLGRWSNHLIAVAYRGQP